MARFGQAFLPLSAEQLHQPARLRNSQPVVMLIKRDRSGFRYCFAMRQGVTHRTGLRIGVTQFIRVFPWHLVSEVTACHTRRMNHTRVTTM